MTTRKRAPSSTAAPELLTSARNRLGSKQVSDIQRARMLTAMTEVAAERGAANVTIVHIVARAGVSRRTFYELFDDREDCFLAVLDEAVERVSLLVGQAYRDERRWREGMRAALLALLEFLEDEPNMAWLLVVDSLGAGARALERRQRVLKDLVAVVDRGRTEAKANPDLAAIAAEGVVGALSAVIHARLVDDQHRPLVGLVNELMSIIVLPYLGPAAARRELERPLPKHKARAPQTRPDPLRELEMRLTYRTVRVLTALASHPRSSNRKVAEASGITDQGQMSKLLGRLGHLGLIENRRAGSARGEPNAWILTDSGRQVQQAITAQAVRGGPQREEIPDLVAPTATW
jgi:AcrR family transcriptional regulator/DNA-binding MarR family transcriptional regulator